MQLQEGRLTVGVENEIDELVRRSMAPVDHEKMMSAREGRDAELVPMLERELLEERAKTAQALKDKEVGCAGFHGNGFSLDDPIPFRSCNWNC